MFKNLNCQEGYESPIKGIFVFQEEEEQMNLDLNESSPV